VSRKVNIGIIQMNSKLGDVELNVSRALRFIQEAVEMKANIVCLPELFSTGYNMKILAEKNAEIGLRYYDYIVDRISNTAKENKIFVVAPFAERKNSSGVVYNSAILFDDEGNICGSYAKTHLYSSERLYFKEGSQYKVFNTTYGKIGIMICYDAGFPEVCRTLCLLGAEIVFVPSAWRTQDEYMWDLNLPQRALENLLFVVGVNGVGTENKLHLFGRSKICNPQGTIIIELPKDEEKVVVATINLSDIERFRAEIAYLKDRRPLLYVKVTKVQQY